MTKISFLSIKYMSVCLSVPGQITIYIFLSAFPKYTSIDLGYRPVRSLCKLCLVIQITLKLHLHTRYMNVRRVSAWWRLAYVWKENIPNLASSTHTIDIFKKKYENILENKLSHLNTAL